VRCEKVPRSTSCPVRRTGLPSRRSEQIASASPVAQSILPRRLDRLGAGVEKRAIVRVRIKSLSGVW